MIKFVLSTWTVEFADDLHFLCQTDLIVWLLQKRFTLFGKV